MAQLQHARGREKKTANLKVAIMLQCFSDQFRRMPFYERRVIGACSIDALNLSASLVGQI